MYKIIFMIFNRNRNQSTSINSTMVKTIISENRKYYPTNKKLQTIDPTFLRSTNNIRISFAVQRTKTKYDLIFYKIHICEKRRCK